MAQCPLVEGKARSCPHCGDWLYWDSEDGEWCCLGCARRYAPGSELLADSSLKAIPSEAEREPSPIPATHNEGALPRGEGAKTPSPSRLANKRQEEESPARYIRPYSSDGGWFSPREIVFTPEQVLWLLPLLPLLRVGGYPPDPKETGYSEEPIARRRKGAKRQGYFTIPVELASELDARLERVGQDGILLEFVYTAESADKLSLKSHIAIAFRTTVEDIDRRCFRALKYVSGWRRKRDYHSYIHHKRGKEKRDGG